MLLHPTPFAALVATIWLCGLAHVHAGTGTAPPPREGDQTAPTAQWTLTPDGTHIVQPRFRLIWPRCVEGMQWNGRHCVGTPLLLDHAQAVEHVRQRNLADGMRWRLPSAKELQIVSQLNMQAIKSGSTAPMPDATLGWCWSGTTNVMRQHLNPYNYGNIARGPGGTGGQQLDLQNGWVVNTGTAEMRGDISRRTPMMLRLVRAADRPD